MKLLIELAIFCVMAAVIQAGVYITYNNHDNDNYSVSKEIVGENLKVIEDTDMKTNISVKSKANQTTIRPEASPGVLLNTFHLIFKKTGIFPDSGLDSRRVLVRNVFSGKCIATKKDLDNTFTKGIEVPCKGTEEDKQGFLVRLEHVGDGYVTFTFSNHYCLGAGFDSWSYVYASTSSSTFCKASPSHHWAIVQRGNHVIFKNRESNRCLTSWPKWEELFVDNNDCKQDDPYQEYQICEQTGTKCWPPNAQ